jgi:PiT family inorganic phosphate transporter
MAAVIAAILWNLLTWFFGLPSSSSHAIIGGLVGASLMATQSLASVNWGVHGFSLLHPAGVLGVALVLLISPIQGFIAGLLFQRLVARSLRRARPSANVVLKRLQWVTAAALAFSHGTNDAQKTMGIITLLLVSGGWLSSFEIPFWVKLSAALMLAAGALSGGWRIMRTIGRGIFRVRPIHGFSSQAASAAIILGNALAGGPVSTTHVVSSTVMGVGTEAKAKAVRWSKVREILMTWLITIPGSMFLAAVIWLALRVLIGEAVFGNE